MRWEHLRVFLCLNLAARKTLGIPKRPGARRREAPNYPLDTVEIRINSSQAAADAGIANGNRCAANKQAAG